MYPIYFKMIENQKNPDRQYFLRILFIRIFLYVLISDQQGDGMAFRIRLCFRFQAYRQAMSCCLWRTLPALPAVCNGCPTAYHFAMLHWSIADRREGWFCQLISNKTYIVADAP